MLIRIYRPVPHQYEIKQLTRAQLAELFRNDLGLEKVDVLKISRVITRRRGLA